ncbi:hypothetical protein M231_07588 [Tremella mesenterica]|uniref:Uncharacterized protein n=1 Tax=Tremella mesenterica TaxID=5217 RepID=A0A4V1M300_TREME|nr:hypothetical protein M231_07588 [Tremella mesenterica]
MDSYHQTLVDTENPLTCTTDIEPLGGGELRPQREGNLDSADFKLDLPSFWARVQWPKRTFIATIDPSSTLLCLAASKGNEITYLPNKRAVEAIARTWKSELQATQKSFKVRSQASDPSRRKLEVVHAISTLIGTVLSNSYLNVLERLSEEGLLQTCYNMSVSTFLGDFLPSHPGIMQYLNPHIVHDKIVFLAKCNPKLGNCKIKVNKKDKQAWWATVSTRITEINSTEAGIKDTEEDNGMVDEAELSSPETSGEDDGVPSWRVPSRKGLTKFEEDHMTADHNEHDQTLKIVCVYELWL